MGKTLRVLNVEDSERDAALLTRHLTSAGYKLISERIDTADGMKAALNAEEWDIVLCDYSMPHFNAMAALSVLRNLGLDIPFIIISGTVGEDVAVEAMLKGANDYLPKDNLTRLVPAIERELNEAKNRRMKRETEAALKASEAELRALFQTMNDVILVLDSEGRHLKVAPTNPTQFYRQSLHRIGKTVHEIFPAEVADLILGNITRSLDEARTLHVEYALVIDGQDVWFDATVTPMTEETVMWVAREVTERKRSQNERRIILDIIQGVVTTPNLDEFLKLVHRSISELVYAENCFVMLHDPETDMVSFEFWVDKHDPPPRPQMAGKGFANYVLLTGTHLLLTEEATKRMYQEGEAEQVGSPSPSWLGVPLRTPVRTIGVLVVQHYEIKNAYEQRDLEFLSSVGDQIALAIERKRTEEGLRESESLLASSQSVTHIGSWIVDLTGSDDLDETNVRWSDEHYRILGFEPGQVEVSSETFYNSVHPEDRTRVSETLREAIEQRKPYDIEHRIILPDGSERIVHGQAELVFDSQTGKALQIRGSIQDITEIRRAESVLRESEESYRDLVENALDIIYTHDLEGNYTSVNTAGEKITGYTPQEALALNMSATVAPEFLDKGRQMIAAKLAGDQITAYELELIAKDGHRVPVEVNTRIIHENGVPVGVQGIARDITERKKADAELRESEEKYRTILESIEDGYFEVDVAGNFTFFNDSLCGIFGYLRDEMLGMNNREYMDDPNAKRVYQTFNEVFRTGSPAIAFDWEIIRKDGIKRFIEASVSPRKGSDGKTDGFRGLVRDITERKQQEAARLVSEQKYQDIFDLAPVGIYRSLLDGTLLTVNNALAEMMGYDSPSELLNTNISGFYFDQDERENLIAEYIDVGRVFDLDLHWKRKDGSPIWIQLTCRVITGATDGQECFEGFVRDVTESKQMNEALRESETRLRAIIDTEPECVKLLAKDGSLLEMNPAGLRMIEADSFEQVANESVFGMIAEDYRKAFRDLTKRVFRGESGTLEFQIVGLKGTHRWLDTHASPLRDATGKITALLGITRDVTESKHADKALRESNEKFQQLAENITDAFWIRSPDLSEVQYVSPAFEKIWGRSVESLYADPHEWSDFILPDDRERVTGAFGELVAEGSSLDIEYRIVRPDGELRWVRVRGFPVRDDSGELIRHAGIVTDITERKLADAAIRDSEERFSGAFEFAPIGVALVAPDGRWLKVNRALCELVGYTDVELLTSSFQAITHPDDLELDMANVKAMLAGEIESYQMEKRYIHKLGQIVSVLLNVSLVRDSDGQPRYFISQIQDMTGRKQLEDQFRQSQKMEAVGVLAGGIAHDFNNLLTAINGYSDLTLRKMGPDDPLRRNIVEVKEAGTRAAELTGQLLAFSRKQVLRSEVINLNTVVTNIENMLRRIIKESVELRVVLDPKLGNVKADPGQVEQVVMNLAINARDAMPDGGTLTIETQNVHLDKDYVSQHIDVSPGEFIKMTVTDTGQGMDALTQSHMFEPFFTTKEIGKGTGLGLSTVYGIVKQSGGDIMVYSEPGHGTTFKIYLPCVDEIAEKPAWKGEREDKYIGTETILLVEDEEVVRNLVNEVLSGNGYKVLEAASGKEALSICDSYEGSIEMVLTDVIMPKMGGAELRDQIVKLRPEIKILFMSGYTDDSVAHRGVLDATVDFIEKPFTPDGLVRKVWDVLK